MCAIESSYRDSVYKKIANEDNDRHLEEKKKHKEIKFNLVEVHSAGDCKTVCNSEQNKY